MQVLLINQNATIERLAKLSSGKLGYELVGAKDFSEVDGDKYGFIIIDSDLYKDDDFTALKEKLPDAKYILIVSKGSERPNGFNVYIEKPFLPTELVEIFTSLASDMPMGDDLSEDDVFGDSTFDSFAEDNQLGSIDELHDLGDLHDFSNDSLSEIESHDLDNHEFSFDAITDDIKTSLEDDISLDTTSDGSSGYEEIALDHNDLSFDEPIESTDNTSVSDIDSDINIDELNLEEEPLNTNAEEEISLEDYQMNANTDDDLLESRKEDFDIGEDFVRDDNNIRDNGIGEISIEDDQHDAFEELDYAKGEDTMEELSGIEEDVQQSDANESKIFDEDEVNKLKDLLDETEEEKLEHDDFDLDNIKIQNDELGSLTEESLAEALGVSVSGNSNDSDLDLDMENDLDINAGLNSDNTIEDDLSASISEPMTMPAAPTPAKNIEINPNQSITLSLDTIKELLETADVTINITLSKKK